MHRKPVKGKITVNLTPMIDVVFQLLLYFILTTNFALGEQVFRLDLPNRGQAADVADPFELKEEPLRVRVGSRSAESADIILEIEGPFPQPATVAQLEKFLKDSLIGGPQGLFAEDHPIIILPRPSTRWAHVVDVFNAAVGAGYTTVHIATPE